MPFQRAYDRESLMEQARRHLPDADRLQVYEVMHGAQPFKLVVWKGKEPAQVQHFRGEELFLACKIIAGKLEIGFHQ